MNLDAADFGIVASTGRELTWHRNKWLLLHEFQTTSRGWLTGHVADLNPEVIQVRVSVSNIVLL
jgi:hypothetical protein